MPLYEYECPNCNTTFDAFRLVAERRNEICSCGTPATIVIGGNVAVHIFTPYYSKALGRWLGNRQEKEAHLKANHLVEVPDVGIEDLEKEAARIKKQEDKIAYKKEEVEFCNKWQDMNG